MKTFWVWLGVLASCATASKTDTSSPENPSNVALLSQKKGQSGNLPIPEEDPEWRALEGSGGGKETLWKLEEGDKPKYYRTWKNRFQLQPYDINDPDFLAPENRLSYRKFASSHPHQALVPNSRDREAESSVVMMFGLTALAAIVCGIFIIYRMQILEAEELDMDAYQNLMLRVVAFAALPWLVLGAWLLTIFGGSVSNPMRDSRLDYHWQCEAMTWLLFVAPLLNTVYFAVHALWISQLFFRLETQSSGSLGRMFTPQPEKKGSDTFTRVLNFATSSSFRHALFFLEVLFVIFGYLLITYRWGSNSQYCHPEVYWATTALVIAAAIIVAFSTLTFIFTVVLGVYSQSPWVQDFFGSFQEAKAYVVLSKMKKEEDAEAEENAGVSKDGEVLPNTTPSGWEATVQEWESLEQDFASDRERHEAIMREHENYVSLVNSAKPPTHPNEMEEDPLVIWGDDESQDGNQGARPEPVTMPRAVYNASMPGNSVQVVTMPPTDSMAAINAQFDQRQPTWASQGFAMPFAQRPSSAPVLPTSEGYMTASGTMHPPTASTIYTQPYPQAAYSSV